MIEREPLSWCTDHLHSSLFFISSIFLSYFCQLRWFHQPLLNFKQTFWPKHDEPWDDYVLIIMFSVVMWILISHYSAEQYILTLLGVFVSAAFLATVPPCINASHSTRKSDYNLSGHRHKYTQIQTRVSPGLFVPILRCSWGQFPEFSFAFTVYVPRHNHAPAALLVKHSKWMFLKAFFFCP